LKLLEAGFTGCLFLIGVAGLNGSVFGLMKDLASRESVVNKCIVGKMFFCSGYFLIPLKPCIKVKKLGSI